MTIPVSKPCGDGVGITPPNNPYFFNDVVDGRVELLPEQSAEQDPRILLSAQLQNNLYVTPASLFSSNVPEAVYKDFISRSLKWKTYIDQSGWKNADSSVQVTAKIVASSIQQEYTLLAQVGQEERCMFGLEKIALHLRDVISLERFFSSLHI